MEHPRITEIFANPPGADRNNEWVELCTNRAVILDDYALRIGSRNLTLSGALAPDTCNIARTGTAAIRNREASVSLLYKGGVVQEVATAGSAPEGFGFHVGVETWWGEATPGAFTAHAPGLPPLLDLTPPSMLPGLLGTAACTAGILTALALFALRHARDRHYAPEGGDPAPRR